MSTEDGRLDNQQVKEKMHELRLLVLGTLPVQPGVKETVNLVFEILTSTVIAIHDTAANSNYDTNTLSDINTHIRNMT